MKKDLIFWYFPFAFASVICACALSRPLPAYSKDVLRSWVENIYIFFGLLAAASSHRPHPPHANLRVGDDGGGFRVALLLALAAACCDAREYRFKREDEGERDEMLVQCEKRAGLRHEMRGWIISSFFFSRLHSLSFVVLARVYTMWNFVGKKRLDEFSSSRNR